MATTAGHPPKPRTPRTTPGQRFDQPGQIQRGVSKLGDYRIVKTLGEGSFGKVKRMYIATIHGRMTNFPISRRTSKDEATCCSQVY